MKDALPYLVKAGVASLVLGGVAYGLTYLIAPTYSSYQTLHFPLAQSGGAGALSSLAGIKGGDGGDSGNVPGLRGLVANPVVASGAQTATGILTSGTCQRFVAEKLKLDERWKVSLDKAAKRIKDATNVRTDKNNFLRVEATTESPELSKEIVDAMYEHLQSRAQDLTLNVSTKSRQLIERSLKDVETRVTQAQADLQRSSATVTNLSAIETAYIDAQRRLEEARLAEIKAKVELNNVESSLARALDQDSITALEAVGATSEANKGSLSELSKILTERRVALADTTSKFQPNSPEYRQAREAAENAERTVGDFIKSQQEAIKAGANPQLIRAKAELKALQEVSAANDALLKSYRRQITQLPLAADAQMRYEALLELRKYLTNELEIAKIAEERDPSRFQVIDEPVVNKEQVGPRRGLIALATVLVALALFLVPFANSRIRYED